MGPLVSAGDVTSLPGAMAELLRAQYESVFSSPNIQRSEPHIDIEGTPILRTIYFFPEDIIKSLKNIRTNCGPDNVPAVFLKNSAAELNRPLSFMWKLSMDRSKIPDCLKRATITPIYEGGGRSIAENC